MRPLPAIVPRLLSTQRRALSRPISLADGWQLGEHNVWGKHTNFELGTRVPLMFRAPHLSPRRVQSIVESVDLYPTLASLAGLPPPPDVDGSDLFALVRTQLSAVRDGSLRDGEARRGESAQPSMTTAGSWEAEPWHLHEGEGDKGAASHAASDGLGRAAFSEYPRCCHNLTTPWDDTTSCTRTPRTRFTAMGYSVRVDVWRYTVWLHWDAQRLVGNFARPPIARELYSHPSGRADANFDANENVNVVDQYQHIAAQLHLRAVQQWANQPTTPVEAR